MGNDYYIACKDCHKFVDLGRWRIFPDFRFPNASPDLFPGAGNVAAVSIEAAMLFERLKAMDDPFSVLNMGNSEYQKLAGILVAFCNEHQTHELYFMNGTGDFPWSACDRYPWYEWSEIIGPNTNIGNVDLPKNLIHDLNLRSWDEIEKHLLRSPRYDPITFPGDIDLVKYGFEQVLKDS